MYNRTNVEEGNSTEGKVWQAQRDHSGLEPLPSALDVAHLTVDHLCSLLLAADSGQRSEGYGRVAGEEEWKTAVEAAALEPGRGYAVFEAPTFEVTCHNESALEAAHAFDGGPFGQEYLVRSMESSTHKVTQSP